MAHRLQHHVEHRRHARRVALAQRPGGLLVDIAVGGADHLPGDLQRPVEGLHVIGLAQPVGEAARLRQQRLVGLAEGAQLRHLAAAVLGHHGEHPLGQVAEVVGEIVVDPADEGPVGEVAVVAEGDLAQQEIAHLVDPVTLGDLEGVDHVAERLGDLLSFAGPPAVGEDPFRRRDPGGHQEGRPVDRVEAQDILAHHVQVRRPEGGERLTVFIGIADGRDVVCERVQPDVHDVVRIVRHRHAPAEGGAADREVAQARFHEGDDLVAPAFGQDEAGRFVKLEQPFAPGRQPEEIGRLLDPFDRSPRGRE